MFISFKSLPKLVDRPPPTGPSVHSNCWHVEIRGLCLANMSLDSQCGGGMIFPTQTFKWGAPTNWQPL